MKILYLCHRLPFPPKRGGKIRPFNMIKHLSQYHQVTVASLARSDAEAQAGRGLEDYCERTIAYTVKEPWQSLRMVMYLPTLIPSSMGYFFSRRLQQALTEEIKHGQYDLIFVHCSSVAQYVEDVNHIPKVLDFGDMDSQKWLTYARYRRLPLSWGYWLEGIKLKRTEKRLAAKFDLCTCTTAAELETLNELAPGLASDWFPNGVDHDFFHPDESDSPSYDDNLISFIGRMDYYPNQECMISFCQHVLPLLKQQRPAIRLSIVGADPSAAIRALGNIPGVTVTGSVADVRPFVKASAAMIAPLNIARGTQNKILEAMAMGVPVVTSPLAAKGVDARPGEHLLTADTPAQYSETILSLLSDRALRQRFATAGREQVLARHNWSASMTSLDNIIDRCRQNFTASASQRWLKNREIV